MTGHQVFAPRLNAEQLETREVPAIVLAGTFSGTATTATGGQVLVQELAPQTVTTMAGTGGAPQAVTFTGQESDTLSVTLNGSTLLITSTDGSGNGIYVRDQTGVLRRVGNMITVQGVTGLTVDLAQGGNDVVALAGVGSAPVTVNGGPGNDVIDDTSVLVATLRGGDGNDLITATGGSPNPVLLPFLLQPGGVNPSFLPLLGALGGQKSIFGGTGDDQIAGPLFGFLNMLDGGDGNDQIVGGLGLDVITGGTGSDILIGLGGNDVYLAFDVTPDFIFNQRGDVVFADPFDVLAFPR